MRMKEEIGKKKSFLVGQARRDFRHIHRIILSPFWRNRTEKKKFRHTLFILRQIEKHKKCFFGWKKGISTWKLEKKEFTWMENNCYKIIFHFTEKVRKSNM